MWIYHISHIGMEPLELVQIPGGSLTRFMDTTWFDSLLLNGVFLGSRYKQDLVLQTVNSTVSGEIKDLSLLVAPLSSL